MNNRPEKLSRRALLKMTSAVVGSTLIASAGAARISGAMPDLSLMRGQLKGRLKQSVCRWCYNKIAIEDFAKAVSEMGLKGIDLLDPKDWPIAKKYGLTPTMVYGGGQLTVGLNRRDLHDKFVKEFEEAIPRAAAEGIPNIITFSGNRNGMPENEGLDNCVAALNRVKALAEKHNVTICIEYLNSKVDHKDYQFDHMSFGVEVVKRVNSPRVKILLDLYHVQIMEGDLIRKIKDNIQHIGHFHTGGNPGRHELDDTQEVNWRGVARVIADLKFDGWVAHEFVPTRDPLTSLREAVQLFDV